MKMAKKGGIPAIAFAACLLGVIISPWFFIACGALSGFPPVFSFVMLPPLILGSGFLFRRFLSKPENCGTGKLSLVFEAGSWIVIVIFIIFVSGINLMTAFERFGQSCVFFLAASICSLPVVAFRETALEHRLTKIPNAKSVGILLLVLLISVLATIAYLIGTPAFI